MRYDLSNIQKIARERYALSLTGIHGPSHWGRVWENGLRVAKRSGAHVGVVELFSVLHDCCRMDDGYDPEHGARAAKFVEGLIGNAIDGEAVHVEQLLVAIHGHTTVIHTKDVTIGTCWDADRLDIGRVGSNPRREYLNTKAAKDPAMIEWAWRRSR